MSFRFARMNLHDRQPALPFHSPIASLRSGHRVWSR
jgi:hypothetical protein